jgi:hypothetical protein
MIPRIHTKHIIEISENGHGDLFMMHEAMKEWLEENGVEVYEGSTVDDLEWQLLKNQLENISESAYEGEDEAEAKRKFVEDCLNAPTGSFAYVSWY